MGHRMAGHIGVRLSALRGGFVAVFVFLVVFVYLDQGGFLAEGARAGGGVCEGAVRGVCLLEEGADVV